MKIKIVFLIVLVQISLFGFDLNWNEPQISSNCNLFLLEKNITETVPLLSENFSSLHYSTKNSKIEMSFFSGNDFVVKSDSIYDFFYLGTEISANLKNKLLFHTNCWSGYFLGNTDFAFAHSPLNDGWTYNSDIPMLDNVTGNMTYLTEFTKISIGRGKHQIGSNIGGSIILNDKSDDYGYFSANFNFGKISLQFLHATLIPDGIDTLYFYKNYDDKYFVTHKINWSPNRNFKLFIGEHIVYGSRSIDPSYLLPHTFYRITEHRLNDRDNALIYSGLNWEFHRNNFYFNFIFDELVPTEFFANPNDWRNKYAIQMGNSLKFNDAKATIEFVAVRPWMYTHKALPNIFSHNQVGLGFTNGSNLVQISTELNYGFNDFLFATNCIYLKQGSMGNNFSINYDDRPSDIAEWFAGSITEKIILKQTINWLISKNQKIKFGLAKKFLDEDDLVVSIGYQYKY